MGREIVPQYRLWSCFPVSSSRCQCIRSTTLEVQWEVIEIDVKIGKAKNNDSWMLVQYRFDMNGGYSGYKSFETRKGDVYVSWPEKRCSDDGIFCVEFRHTGDVSFYYGNTVRHYSKVSKRERGASKVEYWDCI